MFISKSFKTSPFRVWNMDRRSCNSIQLDIPSNTLHNCSRPRSRYLSCYLVKVYHQLSRVGCFEKNCLILNSRCSASIFNNLGFFGKSISRSLRKMICAKCDHIKLWLNYKTSEKFGNPNHEALRAKDYIGPTFLLF